MKTNKNVWFSLLRRVQSTMLEGEPVYYMDGKRYVKADILKIDPKNKEFTVLLKFGREHLKWVRLDRIAFSVAVL